MSSSGPKFHLDIEGTLRDWDEETITPSQIRDLAGLPAGQPVLEIDLKDNTQRELAENEVVHLRPGLGFSKKVRYQRG